MRLALLAPAFAALVACAPAVSYDAPGEGPDGYSDQRRARDAQLAGTALPPASAISSETLAPAAPPAAADDASARLAADARAALQQTGQAGRMPGAAPDASPPGPAPAALNNAAGISQENDFQAVDARRTIESDAERIARNRAQYQVVQPEALAPRPGNAGPNIVDYALRTGHPVGELVWSRAGINLQAKAARACAAYSSADKAQQDFLARGGPQRDRLGLDPDGDGYACGWDPAPYRRALGN